MRSPICISSSPPNDWDGNPEEGAHYCYVTEIDGWRDYDVVRGLDGPLATDAVRSAVTGYRVTMRGRREVGVLIAFEDRHDGLSYLGIDHSGRTCIEPSLNEALWSILNATRDLMNGHKLEGGPPLAWSSGADPTDA